MKRARWLAVGALLIAVLAWAAWRWSARVPATPAPGPAAADSAAGFRSVRLWFVSPSGDSLVSEPREVIEQTALHDRVATLLDELERGPSGPGVTLVPAGTSLRAAYLDDRGLLTVDLSGTFRARFRGGAGAEELVTAALVRTLCDDLSEVKRVRIVVNGMPLASLAGHLPLDQPLGPEEGP
jgi:germination protein M